MNTMPFKPSRTAPSFVPLVPPQTLADVKAAVMANENIIRPHRKKYLSALSRTSRVLRRPLAEVPVAAPQLRELLSKVHHMPVGISRKSLSNIKSDLSATLLACGAIPLLMIAGEPDGAWLHFLSCATADHQRWGLARFAKYCTARGTAPKDVRPDIVDAFYADLNATQLVGDPEKIRIDTIRNFNRIIRDNVLKLRQLTVPRKDVYVTAALDAYPASLKTEIASYLETLGDPDSMNPKHPDEPMAKVSLRNIEAHLRQFLDAAVAAGYPAGQFKTLADLFEKEIQKAALNVIAERIGKKRSASAANIMATIVAIGKHHLELDEERLEPFRSAKSYYFKGIDNYRPKMSEKNMRRLGQFDDPEAVRALVTLPDHLMREAADMTLGVHAARIAMLATAITLLLACPLRIKNLTQLDLEGHVKLKQSGKQTLYLIHIPAGEVKNHAPIDADFDGFSSRVFARYRDKYRPHLHDAPTTAVFPRRDGQFRDPKHVGEDMSKLIWSRTGLEMHPHLFRHLAAKLHLEAHPGDYETVRRLLGHKKMDTTVGFYAPLSTKAAFASYAKVLDGYGRGTDVRW